MAPVKAPAPAQIAAPDRCRLSLRYRRGKASLLIVLLLAGAWAQFAPWLTHCRLTASSSAVCVIAVIVCSASGRPANKRL